MFALTEDDLGRRILDCPGGAAGFTAEVSRRGGDVTACDIASQMRYPQLEKLLADLSRSGVRGRIVEVDYEFQVGAREMLVCR